MKDVSKASLKKEDVRYIAFEGGGGKGAAYLGASVALENLGILNWIKHSQTGRRVLDRNKIKGLSGASAGSIVAALLSCGYTVLEFSRIMERINKDSLFFDEPLPLKKPSIDLNKLSRRLDSCEEHSKLKYPNAPSVIKFLFSMTPLALFQPWAMLKALGTKPLAIFVGPKMESYILNLIEDFGLMSGCKARQTIDELIALKTRDRRGDRVYGATFEDHFRYHQVELHITGTNIETGESKIFSAASTPKFRVSDAVRISLSFPFVYKPVVISDGELRGTWIDGGLLNNIPMHAFDPPPGGIINKNVLAIRLTRDARRTVDDLGSFINAIQETIFLAGETLQIRTEQERQQQIVIDTGKLDTLNFEPADAILSEAVQNGARAVFEYFNDKDKEMKPLKQYPAERP